MMQNLEILLRAVQYFEVLPPGIRAVVVAMLRRPGRGFCSRKRETHSPSFEATRPLRLRIPVWDEQMGTSSEDAIRWD